MIHIHIRRDGRARRITLEASGHAGHAPAGQNLICAAVSSLLYGFAAEVSAMDPHRFCDGSQIAFGDASGHGRMDLVCRDPYVYRRLIAALSPIERALEKLAADAPDELSLSLH